LTHLRSAVERLRAIAAAEPSNRRAQAFLASSLRRVGDGLAAQAANGAAAESYLEAIRVGEPILDVDSALAGILSGAHAGAGIALAKLGRRQEALEAGHRGVDLCETARRTQPHNMRAVRECAEVRAALGRIQLTAGDWAAGCAELTKSLAEYESLRNGFVLSTRQRADFERAATEAAQCAEKRARR
jgi:tetratricopeptide (TPR) repeat protein